MNKYEVKYRRQVEEIVTELVWASSEENAIEAIKNGEGEHEESQMDHTIHEFGHTVVKL